MSQAQKILTFNRPTNQTIYLVTQTRRPFDVVAIFSYIEDACNFMDILPGMHSIQKRTINTSPITTVSNHTGFPIGWEM